MIRVLFVVLLDNNLSKRFNASFGQKVSNKTMNYKIQKKRGQQQVDHVHCKHKYNIGTYTSYLLIKLRMNYYSFYNS